MNKASKDKEAVNKQGNGYFSRTSFFYSDSTFFPHYGSDTPTYPVWPGFLVRLFCFYVCIYLFFVWLSQVLAAASKIFFWHTSSLDVARALSSCGAQA